MRRPTPRSKRTDPRVPYPTLCRSGKAGQGNDAAAADQAVCHVEADDRIYAARRQRGACDELLRAALFQRRRGRPGGADRAVDGGRDPSAQGGGGSGAGKAEPWFGVREGFRHAGRDRARKSVADGKRGSVREEIGGRRYLKDQKQTN